MKELVCTKASEAAYDLLCPGRPRAQVGAPPLPETEALKKGRALHEALKTGDIDNLPEELREIALDLKEKEERVLRAFFGDDVVAAVVNQRREERLWVKVYNKYEHRGHPDLFLWHGKRALVADYKSGQPEDNEAVNLQLRDYAVLVAGTLGFITSDSILGEVGVTLITPLGEPQIVLYKEHDLREALVQMFKRVEASHQPDAKRIPGLKQCKYCRAKETCVEYKTWASSQLPVAQQTITHGMITMPVEHWPPELRREFCEKIKQIEAGIKWFYDVKKKIVELLKVDPNAVPGWTLAPGAVRTPITNPTLVWERFAAAGGKTEQFISCVKIVKEDLKDAARQVSGLRGKQLDAFIDSLIEGAVERVETEPRLVPEDNKGKASSTGGRHENLQDKA